MKHLIVLLGFLCIFHTYAQNGDNNPFNYDGELARITNIPNSPEAEAFTKYGNTSVNMYTGTPNISVPVYTYQGRELNLPISLSYDATGIKVEQRATQVGLGWSLSVGGRVSRIVNGLPDDYTFSSNGYSTIMESLARGKINTYINDNLSFATEQAMIEYFYFLRDVNNNITDIEPDYFTLNAMGLSEHFVYDLQTFTPRSLTNPRTKIKAIYADPNASQLLVKGWIVTSENGTKYYFEEKEVTHAYGGSGGYDYDRKYYSSWVLTKIESPNKKDIYEFSYRHTGFWNQPLPASRISHVTNNISTNLPSTVTTTDGQTLNTSFYKLDQVYLTDIKHNGNLIISTSMSHRYDIDGINGKVEKLDKIRIHKPCYATPNNCTSDVLKEFDFAYSYFGISDTNNVSQASPSWIRLKLDAMTIKGVSNYDYQKYEFSYHQPENVPPTNSTSQDYLGYFNGASNGTNLYPSYVLDSGLSNQRTFTGADRSPSVSHTVIGMLKRLTYPTGGFTEYDFELHDLTVPVDNTQTISYLSESVNQVTPIDTSLFEYIDANGNRQVCDDAHLSSDPYPNNYPRIKIGQFFIPESGTYQIRFTGGNSRHTEGKIKYFPPEDPSCTEGPCLRPPEINDYNTYCDFYRGPFLLSTYQSINRYQYLNRGYYAYMIITSEEDDGGWNSASINVRKQVVTTVPRSIKKAGLRVASITDYTDESKIALKKNYRYRTEFGGYYSSGIELFSPKFSYVTTYEKNVPRTGDTFVETTLHRNSTGIGNSQQPHIAYEKVYEILGHYRDDNPIASNGYSEYSFHVGETGLVNSRRLPPFTNSFYGNYEVGKPASVTAHNSNSVVLTTTTTTYYDTTIFSQQGISLVQNNSLKYKYIIPYIDTETGRYRYRYENAYWRCFSGGSGGNSTSCNPLPHCPRPSCLLDDLQYSPLSLYRYLANGKTGNTLKVVTKEYFGDNQLTRVVDNVYAGSENHYLLKETITTDSKEAPIKITYKYPSDFNETVYNDMVASNRFMDVIQTETYRNNNKISNRKNRYTGSAIAGFNLFEVSIAKENNLLESRMKLIYDSHNNLVQSNQVEATNTSIKTAYIWGYNRSVPIAKIENLPVASIPAITITSLEDLSNADVDTVSEQSLRVALNNLRTLYPNAMITTYTYDPLIGVTSITDPRGYTMYYRYDAAHRLFEVVDDQGNIINRTEYKYRTQN